MIFSHDCIGDVTKKEWSECRIKSCSITFSFPSCKHICLPFQGSKVDDSNTSFILELGGNFLIKTKCSYPYTLQYVSFPLSSSPLPRLAASFSFYPAISGLCMSHRILDDS